MAAGLWFRRYRFRPRHCSIFYRFPVRISNTSVAPTRLRVRTESQHTDIDVGQAFAVCVATEDTDTIGVATPVPSRAADQQLQRTIPSGEEFTVAPGDTILWVYFHAVGYDAQANVLAAYHASLYVQSVAQPDTMSKHSMVAVAGSVRLQVPDDEQLLRSAAHALMTAAEAGKGQRLQISRRIGVFPYLRAPGRMCGPWARCSAFWTSRRCCATSRHCTAPPVTSCATAAPPSR